MQLLGCIFLTYVIRIFRTIPHNEFEYVTKVKVGKKSIDYNESSTNYYALAFSLIDTGRLDEAIEAANKSLNFIENDIEKSDKDIDKNEIISNTKTLLGVAYQNKGEIEKAKEYYNSAIELNPNKDNFMEFNRKVLKELCKNNRGNIKRMIGYVKGIADRLKINLV